MKKLAAVLVVASVATVSTVAFAGSGPKTGINGSMHDINAAPGSYTHDKFERTCVFCHTPHNAQVVAEGLAPLWNHAQTTQGVMTPYTWISPANGTGPDAIQFQPDPLVGPSRLCMACHDGSTAVDSHGTAGSTPTGSKAMQSSYMDALNNQVNRYITDLTVTHPIGFTWTDAVTARNKDAANPEIVPSTNGFIIDSVDITGDWNTRNGVGRDTASQTSKKIKDTLYGDIMTCATCHEVHNYVNAAPKAGTPGYNYFLYAQEEGSKICLSCHYK